LKFGTLHPLVEIRRHPTDAIARNPDGSIYYRLSFREAELLEGLAHGATFVSPKCRRETAFLARAERDRFVVSEPGDSSHETLARSGGSLIFARFAKLLFPLGPRYLCQPAVAIVSLAVAASMLIHSIPSIRFSTKRPVVEMLTLFAMMLVRSFVHELGHASVLLRFERRVGLAGLDLYLGGLSFFVDSSDALLLDRRKRMLQSLGGVYFEFLFAGFEAAASLLFYDDVASVAGRFIVLTLLGITINLLPVLQLDGYWVLADYLQRPDLKRKASEGAKKWIQNPRGLPSRLATYWIFSLVIGGAMICLSTRAYVEIYWPLIVQSSKGGRLSQTGLAVVLTPTILAAFLTFARACIHIRLLIQRHHLAGNVNQIIDWIEGSLGEHLDHDERKLVLASVVSRKQKLRANERYVQFDFDEGNLVKTGLLQNSSSLPGETSRNSCWLNTAVLRWVGAEDAVHNLGESSRRTGKEQKQSIFYCFPKISGLTDARPQLFGDTDDT
jgi:hypothetical protein